MRTSLKRALVLMAALAVQAVCAGGNNEIALRRNLLDLMDSPGASRIFPPPRMIYLRKLASAEQSGADIDQLLREDAQIEINISPEARLSVTRAGAQSTRNRCGAKTSLLIRISNQGYLTSRINVHAADRFSEKLLAIDPISPALSGADVEYRILDVHPTARGSVEVTLRFDAGPGTSDLGSRSTLPLLFMCDPVAEEKNTDPRLPN